MARAAVAALLSAGCATEPPQAGRPDSGSPPTPSSPSTSATLSTPSRSTPPGPITVASGLDVPWGLAFLPDGSALLTLRDRAEVLRVREGAAPVSLGRVAGAVPGAEGGLLGIAASPRFADDRQVYVYLTAASDNRVARMTLPGGRLGTPQPVLTGIPKAGNHNGGRIAFGPDGHLYIATGDADDPDTAQDRRSLGGKILRVTPDGEPAPGNPFPGSPVWSLGHRNVQGLAWDGAGRLFASEFGQNTWDELNLVRPGGNYGWPEVEGSGGGSRFVQPLRQWSAAEASPSGIAIARDGTVYMAALRGEALWRVPLEGGVAGEPHRLLHEEYGRLRHVAVAPDGRLWLLTNNTARGRPRAGDDRVVVVSPAALR
jgi:glucose/arabinose dehydrogenase